MKKLEIVLAGLFGFIILFVVIVFFWWIGTYNQFVADRQSSTTAWSNVETEYQRRFDLIPNVVAATQGILTQEQAVFGEIAAARTQYAGAQSNSAAQTSAMSGADSAIGRLLVVMENYPTLQSNQNIQTLVVELEGTQNRIAVAQLNYNTAVNQYDTEIQLFPGSFVAGLSGFQSKPLFEATSSASTAPVVQLNQSTTVPTIP
jgi:LemA protein